MTAATLTARLKAATHMAAKVGRLPVDGPEKAQVVRTKVLTAGLYGSETSRVNDITLRGLRRTVAATIVLTARRNGATTNRLPM